MSVEAKLDAADACDVDVREVGGGEIASRVRRERKLWKDFLSLTNLAQT
jgi:hypothetical protein